MPEPFEDHPLPPFWLQCFGPPSLRSRVPGQAEQVLLPSGKPLLILAYLATRFPAAASRQELALLGWGQSDELHSRASLRQAFYRIRQALGPDVVASNDRSAHLTCAIPSDWSTLSAAIATGDDAAMLDGCAGDFLEGIEVDDPDELGDWVNAERTRWSLMLRAAALREGHRALAAGQVERAITLAERALATDNGRLAGWELYLEALRATEATSRLEGGLARLEAAGEHGLLGGNDSSNWQRLVRRYRRPHEEAGAERDVDAEPGVFGLLPFTGRTALWSHVKTLLTRPMSGNHRTIAIIAGPGFGKSRMLRELRLGLKGTATITIAVDAVAAEATTPGALLNRIVEALAALPEARGVDPQAARQLVALNPQLRERFPGTVGFDRSPTSDELTGALAELMGAVGDSRPLVLFIDDLHWGDERSVLVLRGALPMSEAGKIRCIVASRDDASHQLADWHTLHLPSLSAEALEALIAASLPAIGAMQRPEAAHAMLLVTGGVPHYVARAIRRLSELDAPPHDSADARSARLLAAIPQIELYRDLTIPTVAADRTLLEYLAVAGEWINIKELRAVVGMTNPRGFEESLARLERLGWILTEDSGVRLSHNLIQTQVIEGIPPGQQRVLALQRAHWLAWQGTSLHHLQRAVRICLAQGAHSQAVASVRRWCLRMRGGTRGRALAALVLPPDSPRTLRWRVTAAATPSLIWWLGLMCSVFALAVWAGVAWLQQPTSLRSENIPRVQPTEVGQTIVRNMVPPIFTVRDRLGRISTGLDGGGLRVVGRSSSVDSLHLNPLPVVHQGRVSADSLAVFTHSTDSLQLTFQVGDLPPHPLTVFRGYADQSLAIVGGQINGRMLDSIRPEVTVSPGDSLTGSVIFVYTTPAQAALWIMAQSSTMATLATDTASVMTMHTGAARAIGEVRITRRAPLTPGRYWMVWTFAAEPSAVWILSLTNWRCGKPHWNDQNDLLAVPDSMLEHAWGSGWLEAKREICDDPKQVVYHQTRYPTATMRVTVR